MSSLFPPLVHTLGMSFGLGKSRLDTLAVMIVGLANARTVNLSHLASQFPGQFPGCASPASNYRRLQRFFQHITLDQQVVAQIILGMLNIVRPRYLAPLPSS